MRLLGTCAVGAGAAPEALEALSLSLTRAHPTMPGGAQTPGAGALLEVLTAEEHELVATLVDLIIPATDTPGARAVGVQEYIDRMLAGEDADARDTFRRGLAWIDRHARERFGAAFVALPEPDRVRILTDLATADQAASADPAGVAFFEEIKRRTVEGYYRSEVAIRQELPYLGTQTLDRFDGCTHREHLDWTPKA